MKQKTGAGHYRTGGSGLGFLFRGRRGRGGVHEVLVTPLYIVADINIKNLPYKFPLNQLPRFTDINSSSGLGGA